MTPDCVIDTCREQKLVDGKMWDRYWVECVTVAEHGCDVEPRLMFEMKRKNQ